MLNLKSFKFIFLTSVLTLGLSIITSQSLSADTYTVSKGDSLYKISNFFNITTAKIISDNKISGTLIYPGQILLVSGDTYTVKNGDCLFSIAKNYGMSLDDLRKINNKWDNLITPGQILNVSSKNNVTPKTSTIIKTSAVVTTKAPVVASPIIKQNLKSSLDYTASDVDLLARLITAEAQGEPYNAQRAVGAVIVNRVKSSSFPNSISAVIKQNQNGCYQFSPVKSGKINRPATETAVKAAYEALKGNDPTNKALFFYDTSSKSKWMLSLKVSVRINKLIFAY